MRSCFLNFENANTSNSENVETSKLQNFRNPKTSKRERFNISKCQHFTIPKIQNLKKNVNQNIISKFANLEISHRQNFNT